MAGAHQESSFEESITNHLLAHGWVAGNSSDYSRDLGLNPGELFAFVEATQPDEWARLITLQLDLQRPVMGDPDQVLLVAVTRNTECERYVSWGVTPPGSPKANASPGIPETNASTAATGGVDLSCWQRPTVTTLH